MKQRSFLIFYYLSLGALLGFAGAWAAPPLGSANEGVTLSGSQWETVLAQFEGAVSTLADGLGKSRAESAKNQAEIKSLEEKVAALRQANRDNGNVINEIRLKSRLNDLKDKLEENSQLHHELETKQKEFSQKAYSLVSLYNDRIEAVLGASPAGTEPSQADAQLRDLTALVQKRNRVQNLLAEYGPGGQSEKLPSLTALRSLESHDRESLQLTLDLLRDRKKDLEEQLEKWTLEQEEVKNELKLQGKMQDFLEDIHQINEDSNFSRGGLKSNDLEGIAGKSQKNKLEARLADLQAKTAQGGRILSQINQLLEKVQNKLNSSSERTKK